MLMSFSSFASSNFVGEKKALTYAVAGRTHRVVERDLDRFTQMFEAFLTVSTILVVAIVLADALEAKRNGTSAHYQAQRA